MRGRIGEFLQIGIGLAQLQLHGFSLGDIGHRRQHQTVLFARHRAQGDLRRKLRSVLAPPRQIEVHADQPHSGRLCIQAPVPLMHRPQALGQQHLQRIADELRARIAEHHFGVRIDQHDTAFGVDHDHAAGRRLDDFLEHALQAFAHRYIDHGLDHHHPVRGLERADAHLDRELGPVRPQSEQFPAGAHGARTGVAGIHIA